MTLTERVMFACKLTVLPLYVLLGTISDNAGMKEGDRELISCDAFCAVAAYRSKMLRERACPLRESAEKKYVSQLEAELQELEIKKFQLDADNAEISDWIAQLWKCRSKLSKMRHLHALNRDGESQPLLPTPTTPCHPALYRTALCNPAQFSLEPSRPATRCRSLTHVHSIHCRM